MAESQNAHPGFEELPEADLRRRKNLSIVWVIPIVALIDQYAVCGNVELRRGAGREQGLFLLDSHWLTRIGAVQRVVQIKSFGAAD